MQYEEETTKFVGICSMMVETLKLANNDVLESNSTPFLVESITNITCVANAAHPLLAKLKIP
jgi:hypothetical protein